MKYIITAGGTGGHINPAIALADKLINEGHEVVFIASKNKIDFEILKDSKFEVKHLYLKGFIRSKSPISIVKNLINLLFLLKVMMRSFFIIKKNKPVYIIGFGGFITFPILKMGNILGKKTVIHEQNSFPGLANRQASKFVDKIFYTYESSKKYFPVEKQIYTSNPCIDIASLYKNEQKEDYVVFIGGSLGATKINDLAVEFAAKHNIKTILIAGERFAKDYVSSEILEVIAYLENPYELLSKAKLVVARGGATTLMELVALKANALIIPSPNVVNDHQNVNARELEQQGLVRVVEEDIVSINDIINSYNNTNTVDYNFEFESLNRIYGEINE